MNRKRFWDIIEHSRQADDEDAQMQALRESLHTLSEDEVVGFSDIFDDCMGRAYRRDLWAAATIIDGFWVSDDSFEYFRSWLISRGQKVFEDALSNPDTLADAVGKGDVCEFEAFGYVAGWVWEEKTGKTMDQMHPQVPGKARELQGDLEEGEDEYRKRFPRLWEKFQDEDDNDDED